MNKRVSEQRTEAETYKDAIDSPYSSVRPAMANLLGLAVEVLLDIKELLEYQVDNSIDEDLRECLREVDTDRVQGEVFAIPQAFVTDDEDPFFSSPGFSTLSADSDKVENAEYTVYVSREDGHRKPTVQVSGYWNLPLREGSFKSNASFLATWTKEFETNAEAFDAAEKELSKLNDGNHFLPSEGWEKA